MFGRRTLHLLVLAALLFGVGSTCQAAPLAQFDLNDGNGTSPAGWASLNADLATDSATQNGITLTYNPYRDGRGRTYTGIAPYIEVSEDTSVVGSTTDTNTYFVGVTVSGLLSDTEYTFAWHHYLSNDTSIYPRMGIYQDDNSVAGNLLALTGLYGSGSDNYATEFNATTDALGFATFVSGHTQLDTAERLVQALNGFEVVSANVSASVPEPSTFLTAALGLLGLVWYGWRTRRA